jgi:hypothetical protein
MDAVEVEEEVVQFFMSMEPDHEGIVHVSEPAEGLWVHLISKCYIKKLAITEDGRTRGHSVSLFIELPVETEKLSGHGKKVSSCLHQNVRSRDS